MAPPRERGTLGAGVGDAARLATQQGGSMVAKQTPQADTSAADAISNSTAPALPVKTRGVTPEVGPPTDSLSLHVFRRTSNSMYEVRYGGETFTFEAQDGFRYILEALSKPDEGIPATTLHQLGKVLPVSQALREIVADDGVRDALGTSSFGADEPMDDEAQANILKQLNRLSDAADGADATSDGAKSREAVEKIGEYVEQCRKDGYDAKRDADGKWQIWPQRLPGGQALRRTAGSATGQSARSAVANAITRAKAKMQPHLPDFVAHLTEHLNTGHEVRYRSDSSIQWVLQ